MNLETNKFFIGKKASLSKLITEDEVKQFAKISLDTNPVHLDHQYAATTMFKKPIAHGMLTGALVSAVLGTKLPGPGAIYLSQSFNFHKPVYFQENITAHVEITHIDEKENKQGRIDKFITLKTWVENLDYTLVLSGEAKVLVRG
jgi:3-hydroxybutyryl-CoA dehydratase